MQISHLSYKHYLEYLDKKAAFPLKHKIMAALAIAAFILVGVFSSAAYKYQKDAPALAKYQYLVKTSRDFASVNESIGETLDAFKVAGEKVQLVGKIESQPEASSGFFVALDDLEKTGALLESTKQNIEAKKGAFLEESTPNDLIGLANQISGFYDQSSATISDLFADQQFAKELLLASGPKFYVPVLTDDSLWENPQKEKIISYYQDTKTEAGVALERLSRLSSPPHFEQYYNAQIEHLTRLASLSDNVINTLSVSDDSSIDTATQIEKAYQLVIGAKRENEPVVQKLLAERLKLVDLGENMEKLAPVEVQKNSTLKNIQFELANTPKMQDYDVYLGKIFTGFTNTYQYLIKLL